MRLFESDAFYETLSFIMMVLVIFPVSGLLKGALTG
jgi:hypothetical protein